MTQKALVISADDDGWAYVAVNRQSACAKDCSECAGCAPSYNKRITVLADNEIGAREGDEVIVYSETKNIIGMAALLYLVPLLLFFLGYGIAAANGWSPLPVAAIGALLGWLASWLYNRRLVKRNAASCTIKAILGGR